MRLGSGSEPYPRAIRGLGGLGLHEKIVASDPQAAAQWAETIANQNARDRQLESIVVTWLRADPTSATAWLSNSSLSAEAKARLLSVNK